MRASRTFGLAAAVSLSCASASHALVVDFTGGVVTRLDTSLETTNNAVVWDNIDFYEESGFKVDFLPNPGSAGFATHAGDYYTAGNDVVHAHWFTGDFGGVAQVELTRSAGGLFDFDSFVLTSNTDTAEGAASGNELAFVQGFVANVPTGPAVLLPPEGWGFPGTLVTLGTDFDSVDKVTFMVANPVDCFGMDDFNVTAVPEPTTSAVILGALGVIIARRRAPERPDDQAA